jgi:hypothetical protein
VSIRDMIDSSVKCSICGKAGYMTCDCWAKCVRCGWVFEAQKGCRNRECGGDGVAEQMLIGEDEAGPKIPDPWEVWADLLQCRADHHLLRLALEHHENECDDCHCLHGPGMMPSLQLTQDYGQAGYQSYLDEANQLTAEARSARDEIATRLGETERDLLTARTEAAQLRAELERWKNATYSATPADLSGSVADGVTELVEAQTEAAQLREQLAEWRAAYAGTPRDLPGPATPPAAAPGPAPSTKANEIAAAFGAIPYQHCTKCGLVLANQAESDAHQDMCPNEAGK